MTSLSSVYVVFAGVCPANESVLRWWFRDKMASLILDDSLVVKIMSNDAENVQWTIYISGIDILL